MSHTYYCDHFEAEMVQKTVHSCLICGKDILFDSDSMKNHIQKCHSKISIKTYEIEYFNKVVMKTDLGENDWMHRCQYDCKICAVSFREKEELEQHILDEHSMRLINYTSIHGSGALAEVYHTCQVEADEKVCNQKVLWGEQSISNHLSNKHNLSPTDYHNKYMNDYDSNLERTYKKKQQEWANKCSFLCKICNQMFDTKDKLKIHTKEEHKNSEICSSEWDQTVAKFLLHTCQICQENVLWEKEAVTNHLKSKHGISKLDYASKYLESYEENEECQKEMKKYDDWMNRCIFQCLLCESHVSMTRKSTLISHIRCRHKEDRLDYFGRFKDETMTKAVHHVCQICTKSLLWDESAIQKHIKLCHELTPEIYKAKFMSSYTEDTKLIEKLRREENHQLFVATKTSKSKQSDVPLKAKTDKDWEMPEEVRSWARGCLYCCQLCGKDFPGARFFEDHLKSIHRMTAQSYKKTYKSSNVITGYHFCKLCFQNVRHDEVDIYNHFKRDHGNTTVTDYFRQFKAKLKMPRLERSMGASAGSANSNDVENLTKKRQNEDEVDQNRKKSCREKNE